MDPISGIISLGGGLLNNYFAGERQDQQQQFAAAQVQQQENFQERMRSTAYQTATADMKAAGLNPMMAAGVNTSVPSGAAASTSAAPVSDVIGPALTSAMQGARLKNELEVADLQKQNLIQDNYIKQNQVGEVAARTANMIKEGPGIEAKSDTLKNLVEVSVNNALQAKNERKYFDSAIAGALQPTARGMQDLYKMLPNFRIGIGRNSAYGDSFGDRFSGSVGN